MLCMSSFIALAYASLSGGLIGDAIGLIELERIGGTLVVDSSAFVTGGPILRVGVGGGPSINGNGSGNICP